MINPYVRQPTGSMYGVGPISQALANVMALGLQSYQTSREAKARQLAEILAERKRRGALEEERIWRATETEKERGWRMSEAEKARIARAKEAEKGRKSREELIRLQAELKPEKILKPEETGIQREKRADSYFKEIKKITDEGLTSENVTIAEYWINKFNEISDKPIKIKMPPAPKLTYEMLEVEYPEHSATITESRKAKSSPEETLDKIATKMIKKERVKGMGVLERITDIGYEPPSHILSEKVANLLDILMKKEPPSIEFMSPEERGTITEPVSIEDLKSRYPDLVDEIDTATRRGHTAQEIFDYILSKQ